MNRNQWTLLSGIGLGAGLMYLLDPAGGRQRRTLVRNKGTQAWSTGSGVVRKTSTHVGNRAKGLAAGVSSRLRREDEVPDEVIVARVRSKMGRYVAQPSLIGVVAEDGRVALTGPVQASEAGPLLGAVQAVKGVQEVDDRLEVQEGQAAGDFAGFAADASRWSRLRDSRVVSGLKRRETLGAVALSTVALGLLARNLARRNDGPMLQVEVVEVVTVEEEIPITSFDDFRDEVPSSFL